VNDAGVCATVGLGRRRGGDVEVVGWIKAGVGTEMESEEGVKESVRVFGRARVDVTRASTCPSCASAY